MSIKDDNLFKYFINFLDFRLESGSITIGQYELLKISESYFLEYCFRLNNQPKFQLKQLQIYKSKHRDQVLEQLFKNGSDL